ncbi:MAG: Nif3-like dinuclear metal center hexameric protein [Bacteroidales bacterium]|nr:Nif3-like dinuclear metal center hexameric protein [Bacteroidales bacterium]
MLLKEIISVIESFAPLRYQESYDNSGLQVGDVNMDVRTALLSLDVTEEVIAEAIEKKADLIITHHPLLFTGLKKITGNSYIERCILQLVKNNIALYSAHTNLDSVVAGVNGKICEKLGVVNSKVLSPVEGELRKLVTFVPVDHIEKVRSAIFDAGAGVIGKYDCCSFNIEGTGTFKGSDETNPFVGERGQLHFEKEVRIETIFPKAIQKKVLQSLLKAHPYEEVAYDIYPLDNAFEKTGMGMIGSLPNPMNVIEFFNKVKELFGVKVIRHSKIHREKIDRIAVCGGSGSFLISKAIHQGADVFLTGEIKYHQFFDAENKIILVDIGHFESEQFTLEIFYELLTKNLSKFAVHFSKINSNPVNYY